MITGSMCRAARALVEISRSRLAAASHVEEAVIEAFERKIGVPSDAAISALERRWRRSARSSFPKKAPTVPGFA
ncbi:hypothetical protein [Aminobacter anthyllidis]|uniref:hypothetical protein n=1 Tax=Aminobacter anthyllidis TaxID=1035067 RepID=UPI00313C51D0